MKSVCQSIFDLDRTRQKHERESNPRIPGHGANALSHRNRRVYLPKLICNKNPREYENI